MASKTKFEQPFLKSKGIQRILDAQEVRKANLATEEAVRTFYQKHQSAPHFLMDGRAPSISNYLLQTCQVVSKRSDILKRLPKGGLAIESGTKTGNFAKNILEEIAPEKLYVSDFDFSRFDDRTAEAGLQTGNLEKRQGYSWDVISSFPEEHFDLISIDSGQHYAQVARNFDAAYRRLKFGGHILVNNFSPWSPLEQIRYGVYKATCDAINHYNLEMRYIGLHPDGYHSVALRKINPQKRGSLDILARDICVFNMGKVANTAITKALVDSPELFGRRIYSFHVLDREQIDKSKKSYSNAGVSPPPILI